MHDPGSEIGTAGGGGGGGILIVLANYLVEAARRAGTSIGNSIQQAARIIYTWINGLNDEAKVLVNELQRQGTKVTAENVLRAERLSDGRIVWLETGKGGLRGAGMAHIIENHGAEFEQNGIPISSLPDVIMKALRVGNRVGELSPTRPVYQVEFNGRLYNVAITVGDNGFIVGAQIANTYTPY
jgi:filamentous hemagglutinin